MFGHKVMAAWASAFGQESPKLPDSLDKPRWGMWTRLRELVEVNQNIRLIVLAGDQVYNDDVEVEFLSKLTPQKADKQFVDELRPRFIRQYQLYWQHLDFRKVMATTPSVAMWDDHDITDGWGGREISFNGNEFAPKWRLFFKVAKEAFSHYQTARNPIAPEGSPKDVYSTELKLDPLGKIVLADLRSEKNVKEGRLLSLEHEGKLKELLESCSGNFLFFLLPVVPVRTNIQDDERMVGIFKIWLRAQDWIKENHWLSKFLDGGPKWLLIASAITFGLILLPVFGFLLRSSLLVLSLAMIAMAVLAWLSKKIIYSEALPGLTDDLEDGLSAGSNLPVLNRFLTSIFDWQREKPDRQAIILSGDIHTFGMSEILEEKKGEKISSIPQVVSSPIAYYPMPKPVEGFTSTTSEIVLHEDDGIRRHARNITYISKRNFCQITPGQINEKGKLPIRFYLEGHKRPLEFPVRFSSP